MRIKSWATIAAFSVLAAGVSGVTVGCSNPCAGSKSTTEEAAPCAAAPCAGKAAPCAAAPCAGKAAPCAGKAEPCAGT
ncbi:MAG: hypothetical protein HC824_21590 [Synechococcales cyanobacterium RM1_1_8]|nr:hypothetical protein [Synechococcales cyanobacterium RM1_1_8]